MYNGRTLDTDVTSNIVLINEVRSIYYSKIGRGGPDVESSSFGRLLALRYNAHADRFVVR